ncbi:MAG: polyprenyl synthetase family protein [Proteobacteria bacterium]|nr:polyprenyl synthetase family protein [Pseudomonadota bacterium]
MKHSHINSSSQVPSKGLDLQLSPYLNLFNNSWSHFIKTQYQGSYPVVQAADYALTGSGKRIRAMLALLSAEACGSDKRFGLSASVAIEMVHAYSLAHDDLPCMDNDDWRRGRPSLHRAFSESTALLAGDGLLTDSFRVLTDSSFFPDNCLVREQDRLRQVSYLAKSAGTFGMVLGQNLDLHWTNQKDDVTEKILEQIHYLKTGELLGASCALGAISAGANATDADHFFEFGRLIGLAFQAIDDTVDSSLHSGKSMGKDIAQGKLTYLTFYTKAQVLEIAKDLTHQALRHIESKSSRLLGELVQSLVFRDR